MRIKLNDGRRMAGPNGNYGPGEEIDVPDKIGKQIIDAGHAAEVAIVAPAEQATAKAQSKSAPKKKSAPKRKTKSKKVPKKAKEDDDEAESDAD